MPSGSSQTALALHPTSRVAPLRDYQSEAVRTLLRRARPGIAGRKLLHMPTAAGKTTTASAYLQAGALARGMRVLWVTKDWTLLRQAAATVASRTPGATGFMGRIGGASELPALPEDLSAQLVFTTIHTWWARREQLRGLPFAVVIIDEVHWGEDGPLYSALRKAYGRRAMFVGLTATPRAWSGYETVFSVDFDTLATSGHLARPILEAVTDTGVRWTPALSGTHGDFTPGSLRKLARSPKRNKCIVETYVAGRSKYGKTLVFACNIDHAVKLTDLFRERGVPTDCIHSQMSWRDQQGVLRRFASRSGQGGTGVEVLVNVAMMTHGVDIPDIQTIFLARPTTSDILLVQMAGRGARTAPGKNSFFLVDFADIVTTHGDKLRRAGDFIGARRAKSSQSSGRRSARRVHYPYEPAPIQIYRPRPGYEQLDGLELQPEQGFGIEFELTRDGFVHGELPADWASVAGQLLDAVRSVVGEQRCATKPLEEHNGAGKDYSRWNVEPDLTCGWEVTSRVLVGAGGFEETHDVAKALRRTARRLKLTVNASTGTHIHLGVGGASAELLRGLYEFVASIEPALYSLVPPSRFQNDYCKSVRHHLAKVRGLSTLTEWQEWLSNESLRYLLLNATNLFGEKGTIEARLHSGTVEGPKILLWVSLWMRILEAIGRGQLPVLSQSRSFQAPLEGQSHGDIVEIARSIGAGPELQRKLDRRRRALVRRSWRVHPEFGPIAVAARRMWRRAA